jgi:IPT/TIG domain
VRLAARSLAAAVVGVLLVAGTSADAATVTVGPVGGGLVKTRPCPTGGCTFVNTELGAGAGNLVSPINGTIIQFMVTGVTGGFYRLRTLTPPGATPPFAFAGWSEPMSGAVGPFGMFSTALPVVAGQGIGLSVSGGAEVGFLQHAGSTLEWQSEQPQIGPAGEGIAHFDETADFSAVVLPPPTVTGLADAVGSASGGTAVTITGTDLQEVTAVSFGGVAATKLRFAGTERLTAISPPLPTPIGKAKTVPVTVTTLAGSATATTPFTYLPEAAKLPVTPRHCVVPRLTGKRLPAAKRALLKAGCRAGKVTKLRRASARDGRVARQSARPGAKLPLHAKVGLTLVPPSKDDK